MALFRRSSSDAHWSKDYIEHLRSVHFVLIAVAVTCIAVSRTPDIGQLESAQTQIHQILDVVQYQREYSNFKTSFLSITTNDKTYFGEFPRNPSIVQSCDAQHEVAENWALTSGWQEKLSNADDFENFAFQWDIINCGKPSSDQISTIATGGDSGVLSDECFTGISDPCTVAVVEGTRDEYLRNGNLEVELEVSTEPFDGLQAQQMVSRFYEKHPLSHASDVDKATPGFIIAFLPRVAAFIPANLYFQKLPPGTRSHFARQDYMHQKIDNWECHGIFADCFPDLHSVAKNKSQYSLQEVAAFIDKEVSGQSKDFEVLGIKFPKEDLTLWGIVLLCSILAYFCLHLRELSPKISEKDEGLDVAWLGLYPSWYSQVLVWLSLVVLPCAAVFLLGKRGAKYEFLWPHQGASRLARLMDWFRHQPWGTLLIWIFLPLTICAVLGILSCLSAMKLAKLADTARNSPEPESATDLRSMD